MKLPLRRTPAPALPGTIGTVRVDRRTSEVIHRLGAGDLAIIDELDLDAATAKAIAAAGAVAVIDVAPLISGRFPNLGPEILAEAGILLVEAAPESMRGVRDGSTVRLHEGDLFDGVVRIGEGVLVTAEDIARRMDEARQGLGTQLASLAHQAAEHLRREQDLLLHGIGAPEIRTVMAGRPVVVVSEGPDDPGDLRRMRRYIADQRPVLVGVDGGADTLLRLRMRPDLVVLGPPSGAVSKEALTHAREVVLHTTGPTDRAGAQHLERLGVSARTFTSSGNTEDAAMLLAHHGGASLIIPVGAHASLEELIDSKRGGQAGTFLTRLRLGPRVVDARAIPLLYAGRVRMWQLALILLAAVLALVMAGATTPIGNVWWHDAGDWLDDLFHNVRGIFT